MKELNLFSLIVTIRNYLTFGTHTLVWILLSSINSPHHTFWSGLVVTRTNERRSFWWSVGLSGHFGPVTTYGCCLSTRDRLDSYLNVMRKPSVWRGNHDTSRPLRKLTFPVWPIRHSCFPSSLLYTSPYNPGNSKGIGTLSYWGILGGLNGRFQGRGRVTKEADTFA